VIVDEASRKGDVATEPQQTRQRPPPPARRKLVVARTEPSRVPAEKNAVVHIVRRSEETSHSRTHASPVDSASVLAATVSDIHCSPLHLHRLDRCVRGALAIRNNETQVDALGMTRHGAPTRVRFYIVADLL
jgi:hypothetical protein